MSARIDLAPDETGSAAGLWTTLVEIVANGEPSPFTDLCAEWAAELPRRFDFEPPMDGWLSVDLEDEADDRPDV